MERLHVSHGVEVQWRSFELRPAGSPPISAEYRARIEESRPRLNAVARDQYGLELNPGPFGLNSRPALEAAKWAESKSKGREFNAGVMAAYWQEGRDISRQETLIDIVTRIDLSSAELEEILDSRVYAPEVDADIELAQRLGLSSVPAMVFDERYLVLGAQPYDVLVQAVEQILGEGKA